MATDRSCLDTHTRPAKFLMATSVEVARPPGPCRRPPNILSVVDPKPRGTGTRQSKSTGAARRGRLLQRRSCAARKKLRAPRGRDRSRPSSKSRASRGWPPPSTHRGPSCTASRHGRPGLAVEAPGWLPAGAARRPFPPRTCPCVALVLLGLRVGHRSGHPPRPEAAESNPWARRARASAMQPEHTHTHSTPNTNVLRNRQLVGGCFS